MKTVKSGMITICLIIIILVCQLSLIIPHTNEYFGSNNALAGLQLVSNQLYHSAQVLDKSTAGHAFYKTPVRRLDSSIYRQETVQMLRIESPLPIQPVDRRSLIRKNISNYFNGSKYKANHLVS